MTKNNFKELYRKRRRILCFIILILGLLFFTTLIPSIAALGEEEEEEEEEEDNSDDDGWGEFKDYDNDDFDDNWEDNYFDMDDFPDDDREGWGEEDDPDMDDLDNLEEMEAGTNPFDHDTDLDGMVDGFEYLKGWDPLTKEEYIRIDDVPEVERVSPFLYNWFWILTGIIGFMMIIIVFLVFTKRKPQQRPYFPPMQWGPPQQPYPPQQSIRNEYRGFEDEWDRRPPRKGSKRGGYIEDEERRDSRMQWNDQEENTEE